MRSIIPVAITPFDKYGELYLRGIENLYSYLSGFNVDTVFNGGSYAAFALMKREMRIELGIQSTDIALSYGISSIFNVASSSVDEVEILIDQLNAGGAESFAVVAPFYYSNAGLYSIKELAAYLSHVVKGSEKPIFFYNNAKTTGVNLSPQELNTLAKNTGIHGIKDSASDVVKMIGVSELETFNAENGIEYIPGTTASMLLAAPIGFKRCMSGIFLSFPELVSELVHDVESGDLQRSVDTYKRCVKARDLMGKYGPRPVSAYYVLKHKGVDVGVPKFPWPAFDASTEKSLIDDLKKYQLV